MGPSTPFTAPCTPRSPPSTTHVASPHEPSPPRPRLALLLQPRRPHRQHQQGRRVAHLAVAAASKRISDLEAAVGAELLERHSRGVTLTGRARRCAPRAAHPERRRAAGRRAVRLRVAASSAWCACGPTPRRSRSSCRPTSPASSARDPRHPHRAGGAEQQRSRAGGARGPGRHRHLRRPHAGAGLQMLPIPPGQAGAGRAAGACARRSAGRSPSPMRSSSTSSACPQGTSLAQRLQRETAALGQAGCKLRIQVRSFDAMCQMVAAGLGVAVLPDGAVEPHLRSMGLRLIELHDAWVQRSCCSGCATSTAAAAPGAPARRSPAARPARQCPERRRAGRPPSRSAKARLRDRSCRRRRIASQNHTAMSRRRLSSKDDTGHARRGGHTGRRPAPARCTASG